MDINQAKKQSFWSGIVVGALIVGAFMTICTCTILIAQAKYFTAQKNSGVTANNILNSSTTSGSALVNTETSEKIDDIMTVIDQYFYFEDDVDKDLMRENMYRAIMSSLNDPYSVYYNEEELNDLMNDSEGIYYGIGSYVQIDSESSLPLLTKVFPGSPAEKAGLRDGDLVYAADGTVLTGYELSDAVALIKGPQYSTVVLTIIRNGETFDTTVTRDKVETPTVSYEMKENKIGYIQITEFDEVTYDQFVKAYEDLQSQKMESLIIDLRSNPGGNLDTVVNICGEILPKGVITYTVDKYGNREDYKGKGNNVIDIPLVVLVNGYSASASELMTGAIRDYGKGTIIGTNTFGKGIVQRILSLGDGTGVKITTSSYYTPNGECIHKVGIAPDIEVEFDSELYYGEQGIDNQLQYAIEYLKGNK